MQTQKYEVLQPQIDSLIAWIKNNEISIPEIQRPFVWDSSKVRDLMDSLYKGFPIGYLISWKNPDVKMKDGHKALGRKVLIDGQQRVTAITAALLGQEIVTKEYKKQRIRIAFNPFEERFEVLNPAIEKDKSWLPDIALLWEKGKSLLDLLKQVKENNPGVEDSLIFSRLEKLRMITQRQIGLIELASDLEIEVVTEIFIRINSQGVVLSQADFAMSKIASNGSYNGSMIRKCIDYFCHMAIRPEFYNFIKDNDKEFTSSRYFDKMAWLKDENDDLYDPEYSDLLRVAFTSEFNRGRLSDLVSLLSGRNFEKKIFEEEIVKESFEKLECGISNFINETNFKNFLMIIRSAGFISSSQIRSQMTLNFGYMLFLKLKKNQTPKHQIERIVRRWFVLSVLTGRYSGSPESIIDYDIKQFTQENHNEYLANIERAELSDAFWNAALPLNFESPVASSPYFNVFLAALVKSHDKGFLSKEFLVKDLIEYKGDVHHIFPREYLKDFGFKKNQYNQIANYVMMQSEINIKIGKKAPNHYMGEIFHQCKTNNPKYGGIIDPEELKENLVSNCIPLDIVNYTYINYEDFLTERRKLMSEKIKNYYFKL